MAFGHCIADSQSQTAAGANSPDEANGRVRLGLQLAWQPQAQFAGYYVAQALGFYQEAGIDATIFSRLRLEPNHSPLERLRTGQVDLAILGLATAVRARGEGIALVNVAQTLPRSATILIANANAGIRRLADLQGRRVQLWRSDSAFAVERLLQLYQLDVQRIPQSTTVNLFLRGGVDAMTGMIYNEYHLLLDAGLEPQDLTIFRPAEYGLDFPEDGLYAMASNLAAKQAAIKAFVAASQRGWMQAFADPEQALELVLAEQKAVRIRANRGHQRWMLKQMRALMGEPDATGWDWRLRRDAVQRVAEALQHVRSMSVPLSDIEGLLGQ